MKKIFYTLLILFICSSTAIATTALYRISSGEVLRISTSNDFFADRVNVYLALITNATYPNGTTPHDNDFNFRILGSAKILDGTVIRNATQQEIDTFKPAATDDQNKQYAEIAKLHLQNDQKFRRVMKAYTAILIQYEFDVIHQWLRDFKTQVAAATSLGDLQTRIATLPDFTDYTVDQMQTKIVNKISKDD